MVVPMASRTSGQVSLRLKAARTMAPTAPMAPASVGEARPRAMVPRTRKIRAIEGTMPFSTLIASAQPVAVRASGGRGGILSGRQIDSPAT